jgi:hypothetical protein
MNKMNEVWRLTIEIMDHESIQSLSRTNSNFNKYVQQDSEYIYRKLLERDFNCIKGYKELYLLLKASKATETSVYKKKCFREGLNFDCDKLIRDVNKFSSQSQNSLSVSKLMNMANTTINCMEKNNMKKTLF